MSVTKLIIGSALIASAIIGIAVSCGPSFRRTYQSDASFERCFDMDFNPEESPDLKSQCWREWLDSHIYNQPDDKIRYAEMRRAEIAQGIWVPGPPGYPGTFDHRPKLFDTDIFNRQLDADAGTLDTDTVVVESVDTDRKDTDQK